MKASGWFVRAAFPAGHLAWGWCSQGIFFHVTLLYGVVSAVFFRSDQDKPSSRLTCIVADFASSYPLNELLEGWHRAFWIPIAVAVEPNLAIPVLDDDVCSCAHDPVLS